MGVSTACGLARERLFSVQYVQKGPKINGKTTSRARHTAHLFGSVTRGRPPKRRRNAEARSREYLTASEVEQLIAAAGNNRYGHRDATKYGIRKTDQGNDVTLIVPDMARSQHHSISHRISGNRCHHHCNRLRLCRCRRDQSSV
jgi:hypothetical protein